jgi:hypothetical protein
MVHMKTKSLDSVRAQSCRGLVALVALCLATASPVIWAATVIDLDATLLPDGSLNTWVNKGTLPGDFTSARTTAPAVVEAKAGKGIQFSSTAHYIGSEVPTSLTGNASRTIEAWVSSSTPQGEETVFAWGRRGADGINCSFGHGTDLSFGAVGHWGTADIGWEGNITFGEWTYIVYTYNGDYQTTTVYKDGVVANSEVLSTPLNTAAVSDSGQHACFLWHGGPPKFHRQAEQAPNLLHYIVDKFSQR